MAEAEPNYVENNEHQIFTMPEFDQHHLAGDEFDQQIISGNMPVDYQFAGGDSENQRLVVNEQGFDGNNPESDFGVIPEQNYAEDEDENAVDEDQAIHGLDENQLKQEITENEAMGNAEVISHFEKRDEHENNLGGGGGEKKWPGWPGESVFRMLVPGQKVGNVIGRKGEYIKKIVEETRARIKVLDGPPGSQERAVLLAKFKAMNHSPLLSQL